MPGETPVTFPVGETVAALPVTLHVPPATGCENVTVLPTHILVVPEIGLADVGCTVTTAVL